MKVVALSSLQTSVSNAGITKRTPLRTPENTISCSGPDHDDTVEPRACIRFPQPTPDGSPRQLALLGVFFADFTCTFLSVPDSQVFNEGSRVRMMNLCAVLKMHTSP